ncbi:MAG: deoxyribose-phosphate aldolase, partial [Mycoplasmataceae bacterium]|nr:deoxyribose-phosphate aldolase [Mycoplasmataceae bacterium]
KYIDHTLLKPDATIKEINRLCTEAIKYNFMSVCINPTFVHHCKKVLKKSNVKVCTVIGFPLGANTTDIKIRETQMAIKDGADEIDMVINIGWLKEQKELSLVNEIKAIKKVCGNRCLKVIVETCLLTNAEKVTACRVVLASKANFIKTSTGFSTGGATVEDIHLFAQHMPKRVGIKASGGIKTFKDMLKMIKAGATRIGTSRGVEIMQQAE